MAISYKTSHLILGLLIAATTPLVEGAHAAPADPAGSTVPENAGAIGADLNLSPKRVVFNAATRSATVYVFNQGATSGTYSVELVDEIMRPDGSIQKMSDATADPAAATMAARLKSGRDLMLVTPHRISLAPHDSQTIRIRVHPPADGAPGEYRTHLLISALPPAATGLTADQVGSNGDSTGLSLQIIALYSLSIPLIYRQGPADVRGHIDHIAVRRRNIWRKERGVITESGPRLGLAFRRRACGVASADVRWSVS